MSNARPVIIKRVVSRRDSTTSEESDSDMEGLMSAQRAPPNNKNAIRYHSASQSSLTGHRGKVRYNHLGERLSTVTDVSIVFTCIMTQALTCIMTQVVLVVY